MKKRYLISFILVIVALIMSHSLWWTSEVKDFYLLIIISTISYLFFLKLLDYVADFKDVQNKSRIEIIFLTIFFVFLFIPMSSISNEEISDVENRTLAKFKPFYKDSKINYNFGNDFNEWYNDRFWGRRIFLREYTKLNYALAYRYFKFRQYFVNKKSGWCFVVSEKPIKDMKLLINDNINILNKLNSFCEDNNIKLYVLVVPSKNIIYPEHSSLYEKNLYASRKQDVTVMSQIKASVNVPIIYPYTELLRAKNQDYVYFKTEHHWTDFGAYIGYKELIKEINKDFPQVKNVALEDYNISQNNLIRGDFERNYIIGETISPIPINKSPKKRLHKTLYNYYDHKDKDLLKTDIIDVSMKRGKEFYYPLGSDLKVLQIGTSMNENLSNYLPYTFRNIKYIRLNNVKNKKSDEVFKIMKYYKKDILDYKPDIMILCITQGNLSEVVKFFEE